MPRQRRLGEGLWAATLTRLATLGTLSRDAGEGLRLAQRHLEALFGGRARHQRVVPALDVRVVVQADLMALMPPGPAKNGKIGDRHLVAGGIRRLAEPRIANAVEPV